MKNIALLRSLKMWILIGFCFAAQIVAGSNYNPPMKEITGATISNLTILDFVENGSETNVGQTFYSARSGQTVKVYVKWAQYVYTYRTLLEEAKSMNPGRYSKYATLEQFIAAWVEISGEKAGAENRFKNTGVNIMTGAIEPLPSFTTWMALPTNTPYWGIVDEEGFDVWAKGNCANVILTHMEPAPVAASDAAAPVVAVAPRALGPNEKITCLGDTVVMGTRTASGTYAKSNTLWYSDAGVWYKINTPNPKTELCPSSSKTKTDTIHKLVIIEEIHKKTTSCDCDGKNHTFINDNPCCCGSRKMSQSYSGVGRIATTHRESRWWNGHISFSDDQQPRRYPRIIRQQTQFGGTPSNAGSSGGGSSNAGSSGGVGSNAGSSGGGGSNGGGSVYGVSQRMRRF